LTIYFPPLDRTLTLLIIIRQATAAPIPAITDSTGNPGIAPPILVPMPRVNELDVTVAVAVAVWVLVVVPTYDVEADVTVVFVVLPKVVVAIAVTYVVPEVVSA